MPRPETSHVSKVIVKIAGGPDIGGNVTRLEWVSFVNGGYQVSIKVFDSNFAILRDVVTKDFLKKARKEPTPIKFKLQWLDPENQQEVETDERIAYMTMVKGGAGSGGGAQIEFQGIDPPSWWLNVGESEGIVWTGNVAKVIKDVCQKYFVEREQAMGNEATAEIQKETNDTKEGKWPMFRLDPKSFIQSLMDWSASITPKDTHWIVASVDKKIIIKEQAEIKPVKQGLYSWNTDAPAANDIYEFELLSDNFLTVLQSKLVTQGTSAISGEYYDRITEKEQTSVRDETTENKANAKIAADQGYKKPDDEWSSSIMSIPEHSAGDLGVEYLDYMDGSARGLFLNMLNMVMRCRFRVQGDAAFSDSSELGKTVINVKWMDIESKPYWLHGNWLVYGFRHVFLAGEWFTDLYCARLDYDADAKELTAT